MIAKWGRPHGRGCGWRRRRGYLNQIPGRVRKLKGSFLGIRSSPRRGNATGAEDALKSVQIGRLKRHVLQTPCPAVGNTLELDPLFGSDGKTDSAGFLRHLGQPGPLPVESPKR